MTHPAATPPTAEQVEAQAELQKLAHDYADRCGWPLKEAGFRRCHPDEITECMMRFAADILSIVPRPKIAALASAERASPVFTIDQMRHAFKVGRDTGLNTKFTEECGWTFYKADHIDKVPAERASDAPDGDRCESCGKPVQDGEDYSDPAGSILVGKCCTDIKAPAERAEAVPDDLEEVDCNCRQPGSLGGDCDGSCTVTGTPGRVLQKRAPTRADALDAAGARETIVKALDTVISKRHGQPPGAWLGEARYEEADAIIAALAADDGRSK